MTILCQPAAAPAELISNLGGDVRSVGDLAAALRALNDDPAEDLLVVGPEADAGDALRFAAELRLERPATG
jgi:pilus assembly protein CpaE